MDRPFPTFFHCGGFYVEEKEKQRQKNDRTGLCELYHVAQRRETGETRRSRRGERKRGMTDSRRSDRDYRYAVSYICLSASDMPAA